MTHRTGVMAERLGARMCNANTSAQWGLWFSTQGRPRGQKTARWSVGGVIVIVGCLIAPSRERTLRSEADGRAAQSIQHLENWGSSLIPRCQNLPPRPHHGCILGKKTPVPLAAGSGSGVARTACQCATGCFIGGGGGGGVFASRPGGSACCACGTQAYACQGSEYTSMGTPMTCAAGCSTAMGAVACAYMTQPQALLGLPQPPPASAAAAQLMAALLAGPV